jgi:hypothetical protein
VFGADDDDGRSFFIDPTYVSMGGCLDQSIFEHCNANSWAPCS